MKYIVAAALLLLVATPALAQQVEIQKPSPPTARDREPNLITPGLSDQTRPSDADHYPRGGLVEHDPAFIGPLSSRRSTPTSTGRVGIELNWPRFDQHIGKVIGERETLHVLNHPARYRLDVAQTIERIRRIRAGGIALDAIEVTETGRRHRIYESAAIPLAKIATDDAHGPIHFGQAWIEVDDSRKRDAIIRAIRAVECRLCFATGLSVPRFDDAQSGE